MNSLSQISLFAAFSAGLLSFVSPCVLPLVPSYISYISGLSIEQILFKPIGRHDLAAALGAAG